MSKFYFEDSRGKKIDLPPGKAVCVGRNYVEHIHELENEIPKQTVLFIKPNTAFQPMHSSILIPKHKGPVHHELELAILIGKTITNANQVQSIAAIKGYALALDLTLRELQQTLKSKGLPWERAKAFDGSCPLSPFILSSSDTSIHNLQLFINDKLKQSAATDQMITPIPKLISEISHWFTLEPGDVVLTGTPAGVGQLKPNDNLRFVLDNQLDWELIVNEE